MTRSANDLIGATILSSRDWIVTDVATDGTATLAFYYRVDRTLIAGDFTGPDPTATRLVNEIKVPVSLLWDAIDVGLIEIEPVAQTSDDVGERPSSHSEAPRGFGAIVCADWSKETTHRAVWVALPDTSTIERVVHGSWTLDQLIEHAGSYLSLGPVLIAVDAPIGCPRSLVLGRSEASDFTRWLRTAAENPDFFRPCTETSEWSPQRPFFVVQGGEGGYTRWVERMKEYGVEPLREVDRWTAAKSMFVVSGISGPVGFSAQDIWKAVLKNRRRISVWPFDGLLKELADPERPTLAEIYPRAMYGIALSDQPVDQRNRLSIAKNESECRRSALDALAQQPWVQRFRVKICDRDHALRNPDDFDALMSAAALLRCALEGTPLESAFRHSIEGGMLGSLSLNIHLPERRFPCGPASGAGGVPMPRRLRPLKPPTASRRACPIPGCSHVYESGRGGWDARVASLRTHPNWHPDVTDKRERKRLFRLEFPDFFRD